jgi:threonylcarbamoyladenosine tRNA methylthiotransferase MtaB
MASLSIITLGCKLNQLESESIAGVFVSAGWTLVPEEGSADLYIVNTCTVTAKAEQKARRCIRKALKTNPDAICIVTGCYAQMDPEQVQALAPAHRVIILAGDHKDSLLDLPSYAAPSLFPFFPLLPLTEMIRRWQDGMESFPVSFPLDESRFRFNPADFSFHSRAFLKIQDGCDNHCSYCRVSLARGPNKSQNAEHVLRTLKRLEDTGYAEVVLTGVNISQYRDCQRDLSGLLEYLLTGTERIRIRLSSLEPHSITRSLIDVIGSGRIRPHIHLSIQSGSPAILQKMHRSYTPEQIEETVCTLRAIKSDPFLAGDIIAGFPGETEADFEQTYQLCSRLDLAWIHAFPYSPRPGTQAFHFPHPVPEREAGRRVDSLITLAHAGRRRYLSRWVGKEVEAVIEARPEPSALSENYLKVKLASLPQQKPGTLIRCTLTGIIKEENEQFDVIGEPLMMSQCSL